MRWLLIASLLAACAPPAPASVTVHSHAWTTCGGLAGHPCASAESCVDDPSDNCDPQQGGSDCSGFCIPTNAPSCGGSEGKSCSASQQCVEDPRVTCPTGDTHCSGICLDD